MTAQAQRTVFITGAAGGIGQALVQAFEAQGLSVVSTDRQALARERHVPSDLAALADPPLAPARALLQTLCEHTVGQLAAIVHNAAYQVVRPTSELTVQDWDTTLAVNLMAPFWLTH